MRRHRFAKIIATLGPATSAPETIRALFAAGVDVFRLNFSHGDHDGHRRCFEAIREVESATGRPIGVLLDLQGPKLRVGRVVGGSAMLEEGRSLEFDLDPTPGNSQRIPLPHPEVFTALKPGTNLLVNDGKVRLEVETCGANFAGVRVKVGGEISDHKGVNIPDAVLPISPLTGKDRRDLALGLELGVDWVAASFIQRPRDVLLLREAIGGRTGLVTKLEKPSAVERVDEIIELSDAIMVARGDLGVELPPEDVPSISRRIVRACRSAGKPVIVATQMLESMISSPVPTRAEASDVATAIYDGADAVMLSGETAVGRYPVETVDIMHRIVAKVERDPHYREQIDRALSSPTPTAARRNLRCDAAHRANAVGDRRRDVYQIRIEQLAGRARTAELADSQPDPSHEHGTPSRAGLGSSLRLDRGCRPCGGNGRPGVPHRGCGGIRECGRFARHHGRDALRNLGDDEPAPDRARAVCAHLRIRRSRIRLPVAGAPAAVIERRISGQTRAGVSTAPGPPPPAQPRPES